MSKKGEKSERKNKRNIKQNHKFKLFSYNNIYIANIKNNTVL